MIFHALRQLIEVRAGTNVVFQKRSWGNIYCENFMRGYQRILDTIHTEDECDHRSRNKIYMQTKIDLSYTLKGKHTTFITLGFSIKK
jgi:hypothetical protein